MAAPSTFSRHVPLKNSTITELEDVISSCGANYSCCASSNAKKLTLYLLEFLKKDLKKIPLTHLCQAPHTCNIFAGHIVQHEPPCCACHQKNPYAISCCLGLHISLHNTTCHGKASTGMCTCMPKCVQDNIWLVTEIQDTSMSSCTENKTNVQYSLYYRASQAGTSGHAEVSQLDTQCMQQYAVTDNTGVDQYCCFFADHDRFTQSTGLLPALLAHLSSNALQHIVRTTAMHHLNEHTGCKDRESSIRFYQKEKNEHPTCIETQQYMYM